ncbi:MAG TPA: hypothetical protein PLJ21_05630 [Pseudobdellovibrionaceae bacterium]|nr:hypothetical protein [Pseudobdellovibrionaceae bacterium]
MKTKCLFLALTLLQISLFGSFVRAETQTEFKSLDAQKPGLESFSRTANYVQLGLLYLMYEKSNNKEQMLESIKQGALRSASQEAVKMAIDHSLNSTAKNGELSAGGKAIALYSIGEGVDNFSKAKTDKQRLFATADVATGAVTMAFPPAGVVMAAVVGVTKIADAIVSSEAQARLMEIYAEMQLYISAMIEIQTRLINAENSKFSVYALEVVRLIQEDQKFALKVPEVLVLCSSQSIEDQQSCVSSIGEALHLRRLLIGVITHFVREDFTSSQIWSVVEDTGTSRESLISNLVAFKKDLDALERDFSNQVQDLSVLIGQTRVEEIKQKHNETEIESIMSMCSDSFDNLISSFLSNQLGVLDLEYLSRQFDEVESDCGDITFEQVQAAGRLAEIQGREFFSGRNQFRKMKIQIENLSLK